MSVVRTVWVQSRPENSKHQHDIVLILVSAVRRRTQDSDCPGEDGGVGLGVGSPHGRRASQILGGSGTCKAFGGTE